MIVFVLSVRSLERELPNHDQKDEDAEGEDVCHAAIVALRSPDLGGHVLLRTAEEGQILYFLVSG